MPAITASMVAALRAKTDAPMMECKKALTEADGDMDRAEEILRVKLGNKAGKAAARITAEGVVAAAVDGTTGALVEVNCETDFVSKNESFLAFVKAAAELVAKNNPADVAALSALAYAQDGFGPTLEDVRKGLIGKIGENMSIRRFKRYAGGGSLAHYLHGTRIGVMVEYRRRRRGSQGRGHARGGDEAGGAVVRPRCPASWSTRSARSLPRRPPRAASPPRSSPRWSKVRCRSS
jgi:elongation factor Ts